MTENNVSSGSLSTVAVKDLLLVLGGVVLALAGFAVGRMYPAHTYVEIGTSSYLFDAHTGKACAPFRDSQITADNANRSAGDLWDQAAARLKAAKEKTTTDMIPACGSE